MYVDGMSESLSDQQGISILPGDYRVDVAVVGGNVDVEVWEYR